MTAHVVIIQAARILDEYLVLILSKEDTNIPQIEIPKPSKP